MKLSAISFNTIKPNYTDSAVAKKNAGLNNSNSTPVNLNYQPNAIANKGMVTFKGNLEKRKKKLLTKAQINLKDAIKNKDYETILKYHGIEVEKDDQGMMTLSHFEEPRKSGMFIYTFKDLGIDEDDMFKNIKAIKKDCNFYNSQATSLGNLKSIGEDAFFDNSKITDLGALENIERNVDFFMSEIINLGNLKTIGGNAYFGYKQTNLGVLESIGGDADFENSQVINLGKLKNIGGDADFENSQVINLGALESIGRWAHFNNSKITNLGKLKNIGIGVDIRNSNLKEEDFADIKYTLIANN